MNRTASFTAPATSLRARRRGATLVEGLIVLTTAALLLGNAAPSLDASRERRALEGTAAQLETDIQYARSLSVAQTRNLRLSFGASALGSCYVVHSGAAGDCTCGGAQPVCTRGAQAYRHVLLEQPGAVLLQSNVNSMVFDAVKGTVSPTGTVRVLGRSGKELRQIVNLMGRVRSCTVDQALPGYRDC